MASRLLALFKQVAKKIARALPPYSAVVRMLPHWMAFETVWPFIDGVPGLLVSPYQEHWLFKTARSLPNNASILEIGSYRGRSTVSLAFGCVGTRKHVFTVDTFDGNNVDFFERNFFEECWRNICQRGLESYVTPLVGLSSVVAQEWRRPIHLLFIDGSHQFEDVLMDFHSFFPHVVPGGIVALHDVVETWPGPLKAWHEHIKSHLTNIGQCITLAYGRKPA